MVSLWDMLRFHADKFLGLFNLVADIEKEIEKHDSFLGTEAGTAFVIALVEQIHVELDALKMPVSAKKADRIHKALTLLDSELAEEMSQDIKTHCKQLRQLVVDELEGRIFYYIPDHVDLQDIQPLTVR